MNTATLRQKKSQNFNLEIAGRFLDAFQILNTQKMQPFLGILHQIKKTRTKLINDRSPISCSMY